MGDLVGVRDGVGDAPDGGVGVGVRVFVEVDGGGVPGVFVLVGVGGVPSVPVGPGVRVGRGVFVRVGVRVGRGVFDGVGVAALITSVVWIRG